MSNASFITHGLKFRWINAQCFEFQFSNGKTLLTDPYFDVPERFKEGVGMSLMNFHVEDIENVDYVFINHTMAITSPTSSRFATGFRPL